MSTMLLFILYFKQGNIRVFCRVRPLLNEERLANEGIIQHMSFPDTDGKVLELDKLAETNPNEVPHICTARYPFFSSLVSMYVL